jgi:hypothetical protein
MLVMSSKKKTVVLQADIKETTRTRLKLQAVRLGTTMSQLAEQILDEGLTKLENEADTEKEGAA